MQDMHNIQSTQAVTLQGPEDLSQDRQTQHYSELYTVEEISNNKG